MFQIVIRNFLRGLLIVAPVAATIWLIYVTFSAIDGWLHLEQLLDRRVIPGAGLLVTFAGITLIGFLARLIGLRWLFRQLDALFAKVPLVKILYTALRDLTQAFVGERKRFDQPVAVAPTEDPNLLLLGFLTRDALGELGLPGFASVYVPQSYNFAGQLVLVPRDRIRTLAAGSTQTMKFIVSGGVAEAGAISSSPHR
ncbi:MAG: DUF502 domain-containing protein [bacterium]|nr:DUF502 domain-containing protein [bacterium]